MDKMRKIATRFLVLVILLILAACAGSQVAGEQAVSGPPGLRGERGPAGPAGPAGKDGAPGKDYVPPPGNGLKMQITGVDIADNQLPVVTMTLTDENDLPILAETLEGYGFTIAQVEQDQATKLTRYQSLLLREVEGKPYTWNGQATEPAMAKATQAFADNGGVWENKGEGVYTYTFKNPLAVPADPNLVTVVGMYAYKNNRASVVNDVYSFVKGGTKPIAERQVVTNSACDLCHNPLQAHGGTRSRVGLCVTCHTDQTVDPETGNTLDMKVLIHRLHFGRQLPSVQAGEPYMIVGFRQNVFDFSKDSWPQDLRFCITCHTGGEQSENYKTSPNTSACTSCHDSTNLSTGENHPGGIQTDLTCAACHQPDGKEFDASVTGAHTIPTWSKAIEGIELKILGVEGAAPGSSPVVTFQVSNTAGEPLDPARLASLSLTLAGPTSDYQNRWTEPVVSANNPNLPPLVKAGDDSYTYKFKAAIPADAGGTFAIAMEGYVMETVIPGQDPIRITADNPVAYVALDGGTPQPRREVVDIVNCNVCHMNLEAHGTIRKNIEYCVMCHNPNASDEARRPVEAMPPVTINFPVLIHRLHRGEEASQPLQVYGFGNRLFDFGEVVFPGNLDNCQTCHLPDTFRLPLAKSMQATTVTQEGSVITSVQPVRAVCTSCHDSPETGGHAELNTSPSGVETCLVCHGPGREFDANKAHR